MLHYKMAFASLTPPAQLMTTQPQPRMIRIDFFFPFFSPPFFAGEAVRGARVRMEGIEGLHKFRALDTHYIVISKIIIIIMI